MLIKMNCIPEEEHFLVYLPNFASSSACGLRERCLDPYDENYYNISQMTVFDCGDIVFSYLSAINSKINEYIKLNKEPNNKKLVIIKYREMIRKLTLIYNTIIDFINVSKDFHQKSKEEQDDIIDRYKKIKHFAYLYIVVLQDGFDEGMFDRCLKDPNEFFIERTDQYLYKELNLRASIIAKNLYSNYSLIWVRDQEALFAKDLYNLIFNCNVKLPFNICSHCRGVYDSRKNKTNLCTDCSTKIKNIQNKCDKIYRRIYSNLYMRAERANLSNNKKRENDCEKAKEDFKSYYNNELSKNVKNYGAIDGREVTYIALKEYYNNLQKTALQRGRRKNAQNDETHKRDRLDHESEGEKT